MYEAFSGEAIPVSRYNTDNLAQQYNKLRDTCLRLPDEDQEEVTHNRSPHHVA